LGKLAMRYVTRTAWAAAFIGALVACPAAARHHAPIPPTDPERDAELVIEAKNGMVLFARNETIERHPASLTKLMTLYVLFERLREKKLTLASEFQVSPNAASQPRSHLRLKEGATISVENAIEAIVVLSANDVAVTVAENVGGTEAHFTELMNAKAQELGMTHTFYHNASGLPDSLQLTTAADLAILARHIVYDYPEYFHYFALPYFRYRDSEFGTHDGLLGNYPGADGLKTGYTDQSGYNLVSTAARDGARIIGVVLGGVSANRRNHEMEKLLDAGFAKLKEKAAPPAATPAVR
jgi:D-alanyl-D-alanine carboxypeptidase